MLQAVAVAVRQQIMADLVVLAALEVFQVQQQVEINLLALEAAVLIKVAVAVQALLVLFFLNTHDH